ncbi:MAG: hypothetical protein Q4C98_05575 [Capnocytophaga sp.]|nr:hypothetical protein [Capnocytophaga sp.]
MKIISQFKDYYDYKVAEYGLDTHLVYDRREQVRMFKSTLSTQDIFKKPNDTDALHSVLYIGDKLVHIFATKSHIYTHFDLQNVQDLNAFSTYFDDTKLIALKNGHQISITSFLYTENNYNLYEQLSQDRAKNIYGAKDIPYGVHIRQWDYFADRPILWLSRTHSEKWLHIYPNLYLSEAGIFIDPDFIWQNIVQFLSDLKSQKEIMPEVPNDEKITNKGFDKKTSFRPKMNT